MNSNPRDDISAEEALDMLKNGVPVLDSRISGNLVLTGEDEWGNWGKELVIRNCELDLLSCVSVTFKETVKLVNSHFHDCHFTFSYFLKGLKIDQSTFDDYLDFQAGGHNKEGYPITLNNNHFNGFVNFFDCWYESDVLIKGNNFTKGTNLLGKPNNIPVSFDKRLIIANNIGKLDFDTEGR